MNYHYHRRTLTASEQDHPYVQELLGLLPAVETAMQEFAQGMITLAQYLKAIEAYDRVIYARFYEKPQKTNPINTFQNKKYSTWREQKWAPVFERVRQHLLAQPQWQGHDLTVIQNHAVLETVYAGGYVARKDADGGLALRVTVNGRSELAPVITVEDKGGHCCSYQTNSVNAMALRLHQSFPNEKSMLITDNNVSVGRKIGVEIADNINIFVLERGSNRRHEAYPPLALDRWQQVLDLLTANLSRSQPQDFSAYTVINSGATGCLRDILDRDGLLVNW